MNVIGKVTCCKEDTKETRLISPDLFNQNIFIHETDVMQFFKDEYGILCDPAAIKMWCEVGLLPVFLDGCNKLYLRADLQSVLPSVLKSDKQELATRKRLTLFDFEDQKSIAIGSSTLVDLPCEDLQKDPTLFSAIRNLMSLPPFTEDSPECDLNMPYFSGSRITTSSKQVFDFAKKQVLLSRKVDMIMTSQFARSAHYMGSKRALSGFIVEGISSVLPESGVIVDLMCGSGVISGAFSRVWNTFSSDAQDFCKILSIIHSGGFDRVTAQSVISKITPHIKHNFDLLNGELSDWLEAEEDFFCRDIDETLLSEYKEFTRNFPTLSNGKKSDLWDPDVAVSLRRDASFMTPYCLFTAYFANVYFGLRQCVEIDSIRYAIDQLEAGKEKSWALGALIATLSALGSTYGGHFAQPGVDYEKMTLTKLSSVINTRSFSITHEFIVRFLNLSEQGETYSKGITVIPGPWEEALASLDAQLQGRDVLVYVDPPYKREEYSRYYHVLETLVRYQYPSCTGKGLTPKPGDRFRSEFFTKTNSKINVIMVNLVTNILKRGWRCGWSYSDSGVADICQVIMEVQRKTSCNIKSYAVPFQHKSQGGASPKNVTEYLILFLPATAT